MIRYPFPLRHGVLIYAELPADLTHRDVQRIATWLSDLP